MAINASTVWELRATATAGNLNGGGFNTANANFFTDYTATSATGNSPVISSASYTFVAGDVGAYIYVKSGTNWASGFYQITSVAAGAATVDATIGAAMQYHTETGRYTPNTVAGVATTGSPTGGTCGVSFIHQDAAEATQTDFAAVGSSTTLTSASAPFRASMIGNIFHQTTTGTGGFGVVGWYEIVNYTNTTTVTLDRTPNSGTASVACTGYIGGAMPLNTTGTHSDDNFFEAGAAGNRYFWKSGTNFGIAGTVNIALAGTLSNPILHTGYNTAWGDITTDSQTKPVCSYAGNSLLFTGAYTHLRHIEFTGTTSAGVTIGTNGLAINCKFINNSTTAGRAAVTLNAAARVFACECISYRGNAATIGSNHSMVIGSTLRCSDIGLYYGGVGNQGVIVADNLIVNNVTAAIKFNGGYTQMTNILGNTLAGTPDTTGDGINFITANNSQAAFNNLITGFVNGITCADSSLSAPSQYNNFYNNDTDVTNWQKSVTDMAVNPSFASVGQILFSNGTTSGSVLTSSGADFSTVTDNRDFLHLRSGTGITVGMYKITAHTTTTLTLDIAPGTNATADKVGSVITGYNYAVTGNL